MKKITYNQFLEISAELVAIPFLADDFFAEVGVEEIMEIPPKKFNEVLSLAQKFREFACELAIHKSRTLQSKSRHSGRDITRRM